MTTNRTSYVYVGLAGETAPGRPVQSGLYRMAVGDDRWELLTRGLPEAPAIRAIATHPEQPETVYVGTQHGPYRSTDHGEHWESVDVPDHGLPVWSLLFDPRDASVLYAGYENCEIFRSEDGGEHWQQLAGDRPLPGGDRGARGQPGQARPGAGRQSRPTPTRSTAPSRSAASSAASTAASTGRT